MMSSDPSRRPTPGWRRNIAKGGQQKPAQHRWQEISSTPDTTRAGWSKGKKLAALGAGLGALFVALVIVILMLRPQRPARLILLGAHNAVNLDIPHNAYGWS